MGFSNGTFAKIKKIKETKENYTVAQISISHKIKNTDKYEVTFMSYVKFLGDAHLQIPQENQRIKITSCDVTNCYIKDDKLNFRTPEFVIFGYELQDGNSNNNAQKNDDVAVARIDRRMIEIPDSQLPF